MLYSLEWSVPGMFVVMYRAVVLLDRRKISGPFTPRDQFYTTQHYGHPTVDPLTFALKVGGLVERPLSLSLDELKRLATPAEVVAVNQCSGNSRGFFARSFCAREFRDAGVDFGRVETSVAPQVLVGKAVVVTGTLDGYSREEAEAAIKDRGGKSPGSVSKKTDALVVGAEPGASKLTKAEQLGIPVLDEAGFEMLLATGELPA